MQDVEAALVQVSQLSWHSSHLLLRENVPVGQFRTQPPFRRFNVVFLQVRHDSPGPEQVRHWEAQPRQLFEVSL